MIVLEDYRSLFMNRLVYEKQLSPHTVDAYKKDIDAFSIFVSDYSLVWTELGPQEISLWLDHLFQSHLSPRTIARKLSVLRNFFNFLVVHYDFSKNPFLLFSAPKVKSSVPTVLSVAEMTKTLENMPEKSFLQRRNKCIFFVLYTTGIRSEELCTLQCSDVLFSLGFLRVMGKGSKERLVPLLPITRNFLQRWLEERSTFDKRKSDHLFLSKSGRGLTTGVIRMIVQQFSQNFSKRFHPHAFRYTFASHLLDNQANLRHIQELLGHANLSVTQRYTNISISHLKEKFQLFHPRA